MSYRITVKEKRHDLSNYDIDCGILPVVVHSQRTFNGSSTYDVELAPEFPQRPNCTITSTITIDFEVIPEVDTFTTVCISGSMRYYQAMILEAERLTTLSSIVLMPYASTSDEDLKLRLDDMHLEKIRKSDALYVVTGKDHYYGTSTSNEIEYAINNRVPVWHSTYDGNKYLGTSVWRHLPIKPVPSERSLTPATEDHLEPSFTRTFEGMRYLECLCGYKVVIGRCTGLTDLDVVLLIPQMAPRMMTWKNFTEEYADCAHYLRRWLS